MPKTDDRLLCLLEVLQLVDIPTEDTPSDTISQEEIFPVDLSLDTEDNSDTTGAENNADTPDVGEDAKTPTTTDTLDTDNTTDTLDTDDTIVPSFEIDTDDLMEQVTLPNNLDEMLESTDSTPESVVETTEEVTSEQPEDIQTSDFDINDYNSVDYEDKPELKLNSDIYDSYDLSVTSEDTLDSDSETEATNELVGITISSAIKELEEFTKSDDDEADDTDSEEYIKEKAYLESLILNEGIQIDSKRISKSSIYDFGFDFENNISIDLDDDWIEDDSDEEVVKKPVEKSSKKKKDSLFSKRKRGK